MDNILFQSNETSAELMFEKARCEPNNFMRVEKLENEVITKRIRTINFLLNSLKVLVKKFCFTVFNLFYSSIFQILYYIFLYRMNQMIQ